MHLSSALIALVALLHLLFMVLEMILWDKPLGMRIFGHRAEQARVTKVLAMNQGLYNGFLAAGLIWSLIVDDNGGDHIAVFFLGCVIAAGLFGGMTVNKSILLVQALPAATAMAAVLL